VLAQLSQRLTEVASLHGHWPNLIIERYKRLDCCPPARDCDRSPLGLSWVQMPEPKGSCAFCQFTALREHRFSARGRSSR
jgi:hypothetical protein